MFDIGTDRRRRFVSDCSPVNRSKYRMCLCILQTTGRDSTRAAAAAAAAIQFPSPREGEYFTTIGGTV